MALLIRFLVAMMCLACGAARAAQFEVQPSLGGSWLFVRGEFKVEDGARFQQLVSNVRDLALVVLESNGGALKAGIEIGQTIRERRLGTLVQSGAVCASACAAAWLGGSRRFMEPNARIGFHSSYTQDHRNNPTASRGGNAVLGAYLNRLGLNDRAIFYITDTAPNRIAWLSMDDARALGIDVLAYSAATTITPPSPAPATAPAAAPVAHRLELVAHQFPSMHFDQAGQRPEVALEYFQATYAEDVTFNGALVARARVLDLQRRLAQRWPEQSYVVRPDSVSVLCNAGSGLCDVAGIVDWEWSSWGRGARANGTSQFRFQINAEGQAPLILAETQAVISRQGTGPQ